MFVKSMKRKYYSVGNLDKLISARFLSGKGFIWMKATSQKLRNNRFSDNFKWRWRNIMSESILFSAHYSFPLKFYWLLSEVLEVKFRISLGSFVFLYSHKTLTFLILHYTRLLTLFLKCNIIFIIHGDEMLKYSSIF